MARLQGIEKLREKFDCERDMYVQRIKELERQLTEECSRKDPIASYAACATVKKSVSGCECVHGASWKESDSEFAEDSKVSYMPVVKAPTAESRESVVKAPTAESPPSSVRMHSPLRVC